MGSFSEDDRSHRISESIDPAHTTPAEDPQSYIDARKSQGSQFNQGSGNVQINIFESTAIDAVPPATSEEFRADVLNLLKNLDDAACRAYLPVYLPAGADVTRMARTVRLLGRVRRPLSGPGSGAAKSGKRMTDSGDDPYADEIYSLPAERDDRAGDPPQAWEQVAATHAQLVVLGDPGMGKSWLIRSETHRLAEAACASLAESEVSVDDLAIPVPIRADLLAASAGETLAEVVAGYLVDQNLLARRSGGPMKELVARGGIVLLIDALDEVPQGVSVRGAQAPRKRLEDLLRQWDERLGGRARLVLTTRLAGYTGPPVPGAREIELLPFSAEDTKVAIHAWNLPERAANQVTEQLRDPALAGIARVPLLLALICSLAADVSHQQSMPTTRAGLYGAVVWQFLSAAHRSADRGAQAPVGPIDRQNLLQVLTKVAVTFASSDHGWIDRMPYTDLIAAICDARDSLADLGGSAAAVLTRLTDQAGVLVPAGNPAASEQSYVFLHRTIAEYLVARHLSELPAAQRMTIVEDHQWFTPDWAEVIPMLGGIMAIERPSDAQALVTHFLTRRPDPMHRAVRTVLRILGQVPDPDSVLSAAQAHDLSSRFHGLLERDVTRTGLFRTLALAPSWPRFVTDAMLGRLPDDRWYVRSETVKALARRHEPGVTDALLGMLGDEQKYVRYEAVSALAGRQEPIVAEALIGLLGDDDLTVRRTAADALANMSTPRVTEALLGLLSDANKETRAQASRALAGHRAPRVTEALLGLLGDANEDVRSAAIRALAGREDSRLAELFLKGLRDEGAWVRYAAIEALAQQWAPGLTEVLLGMLGDEHYNVRMSAAEALARRQDPGLAEVLLGKLSNKSSDVQSAAIKALAGRQEPRVTQAIMSLLSDGDFWVISEATKALANRQYPGLTEALLALLANKDPLVQSVTVRSLAGRHELGVTEALLNELRKGFQFAGVAAAEALAGRQDPGVAKALLAQLDERDINFRKAVVQGLAGHREPSVIKALLGLLGDVSVGDAVLQALAELQDPALTTALLRKLRSRLPWVRDGAANALAGRDDPVVLTWICKQTLWTPAKDKRESMFNLADRIADRAYLILPPEMRPKILRRLGALTRRI